MSRVPPPPPPTRAQVNNSYHPGGVHKSASLRRARRAYVTPNLITGGAIVAFIIGVYAYSISAVKQDDFSDVVDLLPPEAERALIRSIEDEMRDREAGILPGGPVPPMRSSNDQILREAADAVDSVSIPPAGVMSYLPRRLNEVEWIRRRGWVEENKGNVIVWGAPNVDNIGRMKDTAAGVQGKRAV